MTISDPNRKYLLSLGYESMLVGGDAEERYQEANAVYQKTDEEAKKRITITIYEKEALIETIFYEYERTVLGVVEYVMTPGEAFRDVLGVLEKTTFKH